MRVSIAYTSSHGSTRRIAERIGETLQQVGHRADMIDLLEDLRPSCGEAEGVVLGGSIHRGRHADQLIAWIEANRDSLERLPSALFSVSLTMAEPDAADRVATHQWLEDLERETGWKPDLEQRFAGTLSYREYSPSLRFLMRHLMKHGGHPTDSSRDYEYTDWRRVDDFAREFAHFIGSAHSPKPSTKRSTPVNLS